MSFTEDCKPYINKYGTFNQSPGESEQNSGNSLLYTATYYQIKEIVNEVDLLKDNADFEHIVSEYQRVNGVLDRKPSNNDDLEAHDDYEGMLNAGMMFPYQTLAHNVLEYGHNNHWSFNNKEPGKFTLRTWFARHWGFVSHTYFSAYMKPSLFERLRWIIAIVSDAYSNDGMSGKVLTWHKIKAYERTKLNLLFCNVAVKIWKHQLAKKCPNLMGDVFKEYFNAEHPFAKHMVSKI